MGGMATFATAVESLCTSYKKMNPFCIPFAIQNMGEPREACSCSASAGVFTMGCAPASQPRSLPRSSLLQGAGVRPPYPSAACCPAPHRARL
jgi:hypothetical protein